MDWKRDLDSWPLSDWSRRVACCSHVWHVQEAGEGPTLLFLHGAGGSTHSWRHQMSAFAGTHHVVALDLPGQGFSRMGRRDRCGLEAMATDIRTLCNEQAWSPSALIAHSAGAAIALKMALDWDDPPLVIGVNPALAPFDGIARWLFPMAAKVLAFNPFTARMLTLGGGSLSQAQSLIEGTGSRLTSEGYEYYARLIGDHQHVDGTLRMMAQWSLDSLLEKLPSLEAHCQFLVGRNDTAVPPENATQAAARMLRADVEVWEAAGHLLHEEQPEAFTRWLKGKLQA